MKKPSFLSISSSLIPTMSTKPPKGTAPSVYSVPLYVLEKDGMSKDDHASAKKDLQKTVDDFVSDLSQMYDKKTKALSL